MIFYYLWFHPTGGIDIPWSLFGDKKKSLDTETKVRKNSKEIEMKVVMIRENRVVADLNVETPVAHVAGTGGTLDRFLNENSDKVAVRRFSSLPPGALYTYGHVSEARAARKLKYMGNKTQQDS